MKRTYLMATIILLTLIISMSTVVVAEENLNLKEGKDYICVNKEKTKSPPLDSKIGVDNKPLCDEGKVPKDVNDENKELNRLIDTETKDITKDLWQNLFGYCMSSKCEWSSSYQFVNNEGVSALLTQHNPYIDPITGRHVKSGIAAIERDTYGYKYNSVEIGWIKTNYASVPKLYIYLVAGGEYDGSGCYNNGCGWVQYSSSIYPGMPLATGVTKEYKIDFWLGDWWLVYNGEYIGYYPSSIWKNLNPFDYANTIEYYGEVASKGSDRTDMGNGLFASNPYAAKIYNQKYYDRTAHLWTNAYTTKWASNPGIYSIYSTGPNSIRYGGPGLSLTTKMPNGGENWVIGKTQTIKWSYTGNIGTSVKIELLKGGIVNRVISYNAPIGSGGSGTYNWSVPTTQTLGTDYKIRIISTSKSIYTDTSDNNFIIGPPASITVISPNGWENWNRGTTHAITWSKTGSPGAYVKIELLKGGIVNKVINSYTPNDGYYSWYISPYQTIGSDYKIRITSTSNSIYKDMSNNYFKIY